MTVKVKSNTNDKQVCFELADCIGVSDKQTDYACSCKSKIFQNFGLMAFGLQSELFAKISDKYCTEIENLIQNTNARFWIDNQSTSMQSLIKEQL